MVCTHVSHGTQWHLVVSGEFVLGNVIRRYVVRRWDTVKPDICLVRRWDITSLGSGWWSCGIQCHLAMSDQFVLYIVSRLYLTRLWIHCLQVMSDEAVNTVSPGFIWRGCEYNVSMLCLTRLWIQWLQAMSDEAVNTMSPGYVWWGCEYSVSRLCLMRLWI